MPIRRSPALSRAYLTIVKVPLIGGKRKESLRLSIRDIYRTRARIGVYRAISERRLEKSTREIVSFRKARHSTVIEQSGSAFSALYRRAF